TKEQYRLMLQRLLAGRFGLRVHRGTKEGTLYSLTIAKSGPKLKAHVEAPPPEDRHGPDDPGQPKFDSGGYPILPRGISMGVLNGKGRMQMSDTELAPLVLRLANQLGAAVRDDTGLTGKYDIALYWSARPPSAEPEVDSGPDLLTAVQEQLGLKLERKKGPVEILVIDHAEKTPIGN
ncbi:MAG TPA: TIGR03435 family protein, partial [Bryobacteraceae bacterium]|nr:TIGR03435 family protein [Bryobacteraceae bacterium]